MRGLLAPRKGMTIGGLAFLFAVVLSTGAFSGVGAAGGEYGFGIVQGPACVEVEGDATDGTSGAVCVVPTNLAALYHSGRVLDGEGVVLKYVSMKANAKSGNCCRGHVIIMK